MLADATKRFPMPGKAAIIHLPAAECVRRTSVGCGGQLVRVEGNLPGSGEESD